MERTLTFGHKAQAMSSVASHRATNMELHLQILSILFTSQKSLMERKLPTQASSVTIDH
jgi:hypothetical protein